MSFGKLNILKHKSWNVWNRDNIEKVLRDERLNREEEQKKRKRVDETESESRTQVLRAMRAREGDLSEDRDAGAAGGGKEGKDCAFLSLADKFVAPDSVPRIEGGGMPLSITTEGKGERGMEGEGDDVQVVVHKGFSIFAGMEHELAAAAENATAQGVQNKEAVEEKRKEKEKFDRQWGLVGLGQDAVTGQMASCRPWYATAQSASAATFDGLGQASTRHGAVPFGIQRSAAEKEAAEEGRKGKADPAASMLHYLAKTRKHKEEKKKKYKHDESEKKWGSGGETQVTEAEKRAKLEKLRADRLSREAGERARVAEIMGARAPPPSRPQHLVSDDYRSGYSSGFASFHGGLVRDKSTHAQSHSRYNGRGR